jgi:H+-translocating NAD(P) transhydrogenase subunit beta
MIDDGRQAVIDVAYLIAAVFFIFGLKFLSSPRTARQGNQIAAAGMGIAVLGTFLSRGWESSNYILIIVGILIGGVAAGWAARVVKMTAMPQMTAIYNGMGGATAALVSLGEFMHKEGIGTGEKAAIIIGLIIGSISFTGSIIAFMKLQELLPGKPIRIANQQMYNIVAAAALVALTILLLGLDHDTPAKALLWVVFVIALALGFSVVLPIGGADMPVVIAILNSMTGLAAAVAGLALGNQAMVIAGALVGASGSYLTYLMAKAMNRSVANVIFGSWGAVGAETAAGGGGEQLPIRETTPEDVAVQLAYAQKVIVVPGYGLAVAQAQHAVRELADVLKERGVDVKYAIHPVAGRMPGHMNVLLAEANVPYEDLYEMEQINDDFATTDVSLVIGANDVTNPAARDDKASPIYGMPILNVDESQNIVVLKRSMKSGYAGIENMLFHDPKTAMLFGDAKDSITRLVSAVNEA